MTVTTRLYPCLSVSIRVYPCLSVSIRVYPCLSVSIRDQDEPRPVAAPALRPVSRPAMGWCWHTLDTHSRTTEPAASRRVRGESTVQWMLQAPRSGPASRSGPATRPGPRLLSQSSLAQAPPSRGRRACRRTPSSRKPASSKPAASESAGRCAASESADSGSNLKARLEIELEGLQSWRRSACAHRRLHRTHGA